MSLIVSLIIMTVLAVVIRNPLKRFPVVFYALAVLVSIAGIYLTLYISPYPPVRAFAYAIQKGHVGFSLFAVVMFIGVFGANTAVRRYFNPVRAELSIVAAILIAGHFCLYLRNYLFMGGDLASLKPNVLFALILAFIILVLLIALTVTSFNAVKRKMKQKSWKNLQRTAYIFFALVYFHLLGYLLPAALAGMTTVTVNLIVYTVLFVAYAVFRVRRAVVDKKALEAKAQQA